MRDHEHEQCPVCEKLEQRVNSQELLIRGLSKDLDTMRNTLAGRYGEQAAEVIFNLMERHKHELHLRSNRLDELHSDLNDLHELNFQLGEQLREYQKIHP